LYQGEGNAIAVSEAILFLEYDLHKQLMFKLEVHCVDMTHS